MPAIPNTIVTDDVVHALDQEFVEHFDESIEEFNQVLGIVTPEVLPAGAALYTYKTTGALNDAAVAEGEEVPLSHYSVTKTPVGELEVHPYRKLTTAQAILKGGVVNSILREDTKMMKDIRATIANKFFTFIKGGTGTATGVGLQDTLAQTRAELDVTLENDHNSTESVVHFINHKDVADYLGKAQVTIQNLFGMTYLENFLGVENVFLTNRVEKGTIWMTPSENLRMFAPDFGALSQGGLSYTVGDAGLIGVYHKPAYERTSVETYALTGVTYMPEYENYIVKGTIAPSA